MLRFYREVLTIVKTRKRWSRKKRKTQNVNRKNVKRKTNEGTRCDPFGYRVSRVFFRMNGVDQADHGAFRACHIDREAERPSDAMPRATARSS